jgi:Outer membrane protein and related peptidoglycan-associated (lipo)proteins
MMRFAQATFVLLLLVACGGKTTPTTLPEQPSPPPARDVIALLPDPETNAIGVAVVSSQHGGSTELTGKKPATRVELGHKPKDPFDISPEEVQQLFGDALAARPPAPRQFVLYFRFESDQLTPESEMLLTEILAFVKMRPAPDVTVVGHTDTKGSAQLNIDLGRSRATVIRERLIAVGVDGRLISVASHGESDLLVPTPDETLEPRNRRVEVSVR